MNLLGLSKINMTFGERTLFDGVSLGIYENEKIGFVGANGAGKTTLFKIMTGELAATDGEIFKSRELKLGYLRQHMETSSDKTLYDEVLSAFSELIKMEGELLALAAEMETDSGIALINRQHSLNEKFIASGGLTYASRTRAALLGLGFSEDELLTPFAALSGGQKTRAMLCRLLLSDSNLLLLDEPTNHLDIESTTWLEGFLRDYRGAFVIISHDRYFLDRVTGKTLEMSHGHLTEYKGSYSVYMKQKEENRVAAERKYENTQREIKRIYGIVEQQRQWNRERNIKTAESKLKQIKRLEDTLEAPESADRQLHFKIGMKKTSGNDVLSVSGLSKSFTGKQVFSDISFELYRKNRAFLLGANGCGKTTLFKIITGELAADGGTVQLGANVSLACYDQAQENLCYEKTIFDELHDEYPKMTNTEIRTALAAFLFRNDDVFKEISALSGGERARVSLLKLMLRGANLLLLDEPTNHLDIASREALEAALADYEGTIFAVSHDRYFINKLADRIIFMHSGGIDCIEGDYDYFTEHRAASDDEGAVRKKTSGDSYREKKQLEAAQRKRENDIKKTEQRISELEEECAALREQLALPEFATDYVKAAELTEKADALDAELEAAIAAWDELTGERGEAEDAANV